MVDRVQVVMLCEERGELELRGRRLPAVALLRGPPADSVVVEAHDSSACGCNCLPMSDGASMSKDSAGSRCVVSPLAIERGLPSRLMRACSAAWSTACWMVERNTVTASSRPTLVHGRSGSFTPSRGTHRALGQSTLQTSHQMKALYSDQ